ncbi:hypothetical protein NDU88_001444 [Pleurodeles waltl]|uniref:Uncharacterized protein n=1 Tax=Pleurodeles waltl TaxID=8319 RepID=A0AAV7SCB2_PLEWA|nr:hypothetical protein NDU88_001444 [Pleurodeles waltl]
MEEDQAVEQQDDLEKMIAHMRAEAMRRGKDWLSAKMEDKGREPAERDEDTTAPPGLADNAAERTPLPPQKPGRRRRSEGKQANKPTKKARVVILNTEDETAATPVDSRLSAPAEEIQLEGLDLTVCDKKDDDRRERKRARKERNFENWLDAFRIMACVIVEKFPHSAADLWLYESKIHEAHRQFPGMLG